jgi:predicted nucleic acid-binding protein
VAELYALDTNVYIRAFRVRESMVALRGFLLRVGMRLRMNAVVAQELRAGAITPAQESVVDDLLAAYSRRDRVIVPSFEAHVEAGRVLAALHRSEGIQISRAGSLVNDVLLATSCREAGVCLVTENVGDFASAQRHLRGFRCRPPIWGQAPQYEAPSHSSP